MFFILSKLLLFLLRPLNWVLALLVFALWGRGPRWRRRALIAALGVFMVFGNRGLSNWAVGWWEMETGTAEQLEGPYDIGILLGGYTSRYVVPNTDRHNFSERANRFLNALELFESGRFQRLLLSGGSGALMPGKGLTEAATTAQWLAATGIPDSLIIVESQSRNTYENARNTARLLKERYPEARCLLLTSAFHMPRALACFERQGVEVDPFSVDHLYEPPGWSLNYWLFPSWKAFYLWELLIKEWVGYLAYRLNGYL